MIIKCVVTDFDNCVTETCSCCWISYNKSFVQTDCLLHCCCQHVTLEGLETREEQLWWQLISIDAASEYTSLP